MAGSLRRGRSPNRERERELVLAFQAGDAAAYESIDRSCRPAAERICRRLLINPADVEEAVQETMVRAYQGLPRFNGSYALKAWVARIATNVCLDTLRARSRRPQNGGTLEPNMDAPNGHDGNGHRDDPEELLEKAAEAEDVRQVLGALPERHRTALVLREFEGLSHRKIAEMLDTSPERVKALIHRAKAGFRRAWSDDNGGRLAAFAPLLLPINWIRRLLGRAPEFDHPVASTTASAAQAASTPVMQSVINMATERVSAAMAAVIVAGTVGFAVQNAPQHSRAQEESVVIEVADVPAAEPEPLKLATEEREEKPQREEPEAALEEAITEPTAESGELEEMVQEDPKEAESPETVEVEASPQPPPHPQGFGYSFSSNRTADEPCGCDPAPQLTQASISVSDQGFSSYSGSMSAFISDSTGQPAWPVVFDISADSGRVELDLKLRDAYGTSVFDVWATHASYGQEAWGGWTYSYGGTYLRRAGPSEHSDAPRSGSFTSTLTFSWSEQRLVSAAYAFSEVA